VPPLIGVFWGAPLVAVAGAEELRGRVLAGLVYPEIDLGWRLLDEAERLLPPETPGALPGDALRAGQSAAAAPIVCFSGRADVSGSGLHPLVLVKASRTEEEPQMSEPNVLDDPLADTVVDDDDVTHQLEDDDSESKQGDPVAFDLGNDPDGGK
jgi:hypothetical protein